MNNKNVKKLQDVHLRPSSPLRLFVWRVRRGMRVALRKDVLAITSDTPAPRLQRLRNVYLHLDELLVKRFPAIEQSPTKEVALTRIRDTLSIELGYEFYEVDEKRPWGGFYRIVDSQVDKFLADFFPGLTREEAGLGNPDTELSPKIMVWMPGQRISWQYHARRAERWHYLTSGMYWRSDKDDLPKARFAKAGDVVQFRHGERHRGAAPDDTYTLIAEIWQHTDPDKPSDESDIVRLQDDYKR